MGIIVGAFEPLRRQMRVNLSSHEMCVPSNSWTLRKSAPASSRCVA
jgi:hypothetical protein